MGFPNQRLSAFARRSMMPTLTHEYERVPKVAGSDDPYGSGTSTAGSPLSAPCLYVEREVVRETAAGRIAVNVPTLVVDRYDPLTVGESVQTIVDGAGNILATGPLVVDDIKPLAALGGLWRKQATLRRAEAVS